MHYGGRHGFGQGTGSLYGEMCPHQADHLQTLQCIALLWTLIKQSPHARKPTIEKCIIACPSSLVKNWANELGAYNSGVHTSRCLIACYSSKMAWPRCDLRPRHRWEGWENRDVREGRSLGGRWREERFPARYPLLTSPAHVSELISTYSNDRVLRDAP